MELFSNNPSLLASFIGLIVILLGVVKFFLPKYFISLESAMDRHDKRAEKMEKNIEEFKKQDSNNQIQRILTSKKLDEVDEDIKDVKKEMKSLNEDMSKKLESVKRHSKNNIEHMENGIKDIFGNNGEKLNKLLDKMERDD